MPLKRYLLFCGDNCYPAGGWSDFIGSYEDRELALETARDKAKRYAWVQVIDSETEQDIFQ